MAKLKMFIAAICGLFGVVETGMATDGGTVIVIGGSVRQLVEVVNTLGAVPIKAKGHTMAMSYCPRLDGFIHVDGEYAVIVVPDPDRGFVSVHIIGDAE